VRGFDLKYAKDIHGRIVPPRMERRNTPCAATSGFSRCAT
jgi:hypothetical protein